MKFFKIIFLVLGLSLSVHAQSFLLGTPLVKISTLPSYNHAPMGIDIVTNPQGFDFSQLQVSSDSAWVIPEIDAANSQLTLSFCTSSLIAQTQTATITIANSTMTNTLYVETLNTAQNITKLIDDPFRSQMYGIHQNGTGLGSVVVYDPVSGTPIANITVGNKPTDLAVSKDGSELLVIHSVDKTIKVIDLTALKIKEIISLPTFANWGADSTTADIGIGPGSVVYYSDGSWAPVLYVMDRNTKTILQSVNIDGNGFGDFATTGDFSKLFGWAQYGWSAGWAGCYLAQYTISTNGTLTLKEKTNSSYPTTLGRDPLNTPVLVDNDNHSVFVKKLQCNASSVNDTLQSFPTDIYSISPGGEIAATKSAVYDTETGISLFNLPVSADVQAISSDYARLVYFDPAAKTLKSIDLLAEIGPEILGRDVSPADGAITLPPDALTWTPVPGVDAYHVYLGTSETDVTSAETNSPFFCGQVNASTLSITNALTPGTTYFWRVDTVSISGIEKGIVRSFTVSTVSSDIAEIQAATVQGHSDFQTSVELTSAQPITWQALSDVPWISFETNSGITPEKLILILDASQLQPGVHTANVTVSGAAGTFFILPVNFRVEPLKLTQLRSDPSSVFAYGISEDTSSSAPRAYLIEINTLTEQISRAVYVGASVTDLAIHHGDNRIYVPNWKTGSLIAVDRFSFDVVRSYAFSPYAGMGYTANDCYRISAGVQGRLIIEEQDQWIDISIFDTQAGTKIKNQGARQGGGGISPDKRYYYHGDDNSSGASIHKFDMIGDTFTELKSIRVTSGGYYGSRTVTASEDGNRVFWNGAAFDKDLNVEWDFGKHIYSCSPDGRYAVSSDGIYDVVQKKKILDLPSNTSVSTFNSNSDKLVVPVGDHIEFFDLSNPTVLPTPVLFFRDHTYNSVTLAWTDKSLETGFTLQKQTASGWETVAAVAANTTNYAVSGLTPLTGYAFRIKADSVDSSSAWSDVLIAITQAAPPSTPNLNTPSVTYDSVALSWSDSDYEDHYVLEKQSGSLNIWRVIASPQAGELTFTDTNVVEGATYSYRIKAVNQLVASAYSNIRSATVPVRPPPSAPQALTATPLSAQEVQITWNDVADETGYRLERRTEDPGSWTVLTELPAGTTEYHDTTVMEKTEYWYRIVAFNSVGDSDYSNEDSAVPANIVSIFSEDFDPGTDPALWNSISGGTATNTGNGFLTSNALFFSSANIRSAETAPLDLSLGGILEFKLRAGNQNVDGWNNSEGGENVVLEYSADGATWKTLQTINTIYPAASSWAVFRVELPEDSLGNNVRLRWRQLSHSGSGFDVWALDDIAVRAAAPEPPGTVPFIMAGGSSDQAVCILWIDAPRASSYNLERAVQNGRWETIAALPAAQTYFIDTNLFPETTYFYRVQAVNAGGVSPYSFITTAVTLPQIDGWIQTNFDSDGKLPRPIDRDTDGIDFLQKYAFNLNVGAPATRWTNNNANKGLPSIWVDSQTGKMCAQFSRRKSDAGSGIQYVVEYCPNLGAPWTEVTNNTEKTSVDSVWECVKFETCPADTACPQGFMRVRVILDADKWPE